jgi:peptidoglycan/xylan/chitin deacetylase (PgdA/CDA1 family)
VRRLLALLLAGHSATAMAAIAPSTGLAPRGAFEHGARTEWKIALTFDACTTRSASPFDPRIPAELDAMQVPATIFVGGGWAREEAPALEALARDPLFEIGNHTFTHPHLTREPDSRIREELLRTQAEIAALTGRAPTLFRPPFGEYDARVLRIAAALGLTTVEYDLPSGDPDPHVSPEALAAWVLREAHAGSIVVMHLNHPTFPTAEALPTIVAGLRARGFELVTVGELLRDARRTPQLAGVAGIPLSKVLVAR